MTEYVAVYAITLQDGVIYAGTSEGMFALQASDGGQIWRTENRGPFSSTPAVANDRGTGNTDCRSGPARCLQMTSARALSDNDP